MCKGLCAWLKLFQPCLFDQILTKAVDWARRYKIEAMRAVKMACRSVAFMGPKGHFAVPCVSRKGAARVQQQLTDPLSPKDRGDKEQPEFCGLVIQRDAKNRSCTRAIHVDNPAAFSRWIMGVYKVVQDRTHQRPEAVIKPVIFCVMRGMRLNQPIQII